MPPPRGGCDVAAELGVQAPLRPGLAPRGRALGARPRPLAAGDAAGLGDALRSGAARGAGGTCDAAPRGEDLLLRWRPGRAPGFYGYELHRRDGRGPWRRIAPLPLRAAEWWTPRRLRAAGISAARRLGVRAARPAADIVLRR